MSQIVTYPREPAWCGCCVAAPRPTEHISCLRQGWGQTEYRLAANAIVTPDQAFMKLPGWLTLPSVRPPVCRAAIKCKNHMSTGKWCRPECVNLPATSSRGGGTWVTGTASTPGRVRTASTTAASAWTLSAVSCTSTTSLSTHWRAPRPARQPTAECWAPACAAPMATKRFSARTRWLSTAAATSQGPTSAADSEPRPPPRCSTTRRSTTRSSCPRPATTRALG
eukprot:364703-Chlamydomonas_euryale.AAC.7